MTNYYCRLMVAQKLDEIKSNKASLNHTNKNTINHRIKEIQSEKEVSYRVQSKIKAKNYHF